MRSVTMWSLGFVVLAGCAKKREAAPAELEELAAFMFQHWEDEATMKGAMENLAPLLEAQVDSEEAEDGWVLTPLGEETIIGINGPENPQLDLLLGAAVAARSPFSLEEHAATLVLADQVFSNPTNYAIYNRVISEGVPADFVAGLEPLIRTENDVETQNFGVTVPYNLLKDYRWIRPSGLLGGDFNDAIIGRAWIAAPGCSPNGANCLNQSWSIDLFYRTDTGTLRFTSTWSEIDSSLNGVISEALRVRALAVGMHQVFESSDEWLAAGGLATASNEAR